ncbi:MAG: cell surface protein SprA [Candidatus Cloacimonetes bacterium]|nr:cell surface protein SprA [Candidatus Cloacimonadota bacterium]
MKIRILILLCLIPLAILANTFEPRLYLPGYYPLINNKADIYKLDKGLNVYRNKPYEIPSMAIERTEKVDFEKQQVIISTILAGQKLIPDIPLSFDAYLANMRAHSFRKSLNTNVKQVTQSTEVSTGGLIGEFVLDLPAIAIPKAVQRVLGNKAGRLNLDGTQKISMQVSSTKRKQIPIYETENRSTLDIKMEQETNLRLTGTIGEKIAVNLKYNSNQDDQLFDPNNVNIRYTGDEDEVVQSVEAGNITLSLTGSKYISYSTSSQGLFGITSKFKYGDLDLSVIASKEEGQKNTMSYVGQSQADSVVFRSRDYAPRTMYFLADPTSLYDLYSEADIGSNPSGWIDNAVKTAPDGSWIIKNANLLPEYGSMNLYYDDAITTNDQPLAIGDTVWVNSYTSYVPRYEKLVEGTDYITDYDAGFITVLKTLNRQATLAVIYERRDGSMVYSADYEVEHELPDNEMIYPFVIRKKNQEPDSDDPDNVWRYQMRNVYNMNKTNVKSEGFLLDIYTLNSDNTRNYNLPDSLSVGGMITYTDYLRLDSSGDGIINGDDATVKLSSGLVVFPFLEPFRPLGEVEIYEKEHEAVNYQNLKFYLSVKGKIGREAIELSQSGILKGSVRVRVNGIDQKENVDYLVDYDFGRITFLTAAGKDPDAKIEIDYENRSMFDVTRKTLAGMRADWQFTDFAKLGGTLIYRSETVSDKRPRIGNENIQMWLANLDGTIGFKPAFITRWIDALPLISTTKASEISLSGEVAYTIPNIYGDADSKRKVSYVDDMEAIMDSYPLGVTISTWVLGSKPYGTALAKGRMNWYNPKNIRREQIEDPATLTERERRETATVLALRHWPSTLYMPGSGVQSWSGVMKYLGNQLDFSEKKYIELLVKVDKPQNEDRPNVTLTVDLGDINEDFYTEYGRPGVPDTEDANQDGVLTLDEDIGLDGIVHGEPGHDPFDLAGTQMDAYGDYPDINGSEGNRVLDTEDLDADGVLDNLDRYFSYSISLADTTGQNHDGWVLYRIPLSDPEAFTIVNSYQTGAPPSLEKISYARIWLQCDSPARVYIADASVIGNKWQDFFVRDAGGRILNESELAAYNTSYLTGIVNNQKNSNHYTSPPGTVYIEEKRESNESALSLDIANLQSSHQVVLRQRMLDSYNLLAYEGLRYWVYPEAMPGAFAHDLEVFFRIGADSLNYYEVSKKVPVVAYMSKMDQNSWSELSFDLQDITALKELDTNASSDTLIVGDTTYFYRGRPTLTAIRELYLGVKNPRTDTQNAPYSGTVFFNDMRVTNPYQEVGIAQRISLNTKLADLATVDMEYESKSENFNPVIQRGRQNSFTSTESFRITNKVFVNKFFPNSWGLDIPVTLRRETTSGSPRYRANSDLLIDNLPNPEDRERERTETQVYYADFGYSMRNQTTNKILLYSLGKLTLSGNMEKRENHSATTIDSTTSWRGTMGYNLNFASDKVSFPILGNYRLGFFPSSFSNSFTLSNNRPQSWNWELREGVYDWHRRTQIVETKLFTSDNNATWPITSDLSLSARYNTKRDLLQKVYFQDINIGKQTEFVQDFGLNYSPNYLPRVMQVSSAVTARFTDMMRKYYETQEGTQVEVFQRDGNSNRSIRANVSLQNSTILTAWASKMRSKRGDSVRPKDPDFKEDRDYMSDGDLKEPELSPEEQKKLDRIEEDNKKREEQKLKELEQKKLEEQKRKEEEQKRLDEEKQKDAEEPKDGEYEASTDEDLKEYEGKTEEELKEDSGGFMEMPSETELLNPDEKTPADSTRKEEKKPGINPVLLLVEYMARIKNITASYQNSYTMNYTRKSNLPPFSFQIGMPHTVERDFLDAIGNDNTITLSSGLFLGRNLDSTLNFAHSFNRRYSTASQQNTATTFPDFTLSLMNWEPWLGISRFLQGARLNTGFQYTTRASGDIDWVKPKQESVTISMSPLIGFTGNIMQKLSTNLSFSMSHTTNTSDMDTYDIVKTSDTQSLNGNLSYSFTQGRGFTIPFTGKKIHIKNQLSASMGINYENSEDVTKGRENSQVDRSNSRLAFTPGATYQFDQNIRGGLTSSYEITTDRKRDDGSRIFSLGVWVEVNL